MSRADAAKWWAGIFAATMPYIHQRLATLTVKPEGWPDGEPNSLPWSYGEDEVLEHLELVIDLPQREGETRGNRPIFCRFSCPSRRYPDTLRSEQRSQHHQAPAPVDEELDREVDRAIRNQIMAEEDHLGLVRGIRIGRTPGHTIILRNILLPLDHHQTGKCRDRLRADSARLQ